eukprot:ANDGO_03571.mRNA.1 hypothetical protein
MDALVRYELQINSTEVPRRLSNDTALAALISTADARASSVNASVVATAEWNTLYVAENISSLQLDDLVLSVLIANTSASLQSLYDLSSFLSFLETQVPGLRNNDSTVSIELNASISAYDTASNRLNRASNATHAFFNSANADAARQALLNASVHSTEESILLPMMSFQSVFIANHTSELADLSNRTNLGVWTSILYAIHDLYRLHSDAIYRLELVGIEIESNLTSFSELLSASRNSIENTTDGIAAASLFLQESLTATRQSQTIEIALQTANRNSTILQIESRIQEANSSLFHDLEYHQLVEMMSWDYRAMMHNNFTDTLIQIPPPQVNVSVPDTLLLRTYSLVTGLKVTLLLDILQVVLTTLVPFTILIAAASATVSVRFPGFVPMILAVSVIFLLGRLAYPALSFALYPQYAPVSDLSSATWTQPSTSVFTRQDNSWIPSTTAVLNDWIGLWWTCIVVVVWLFGPADAFLAHRVRPMFSSLLVLVYATALMLPVFALHAYASSASSRYVDISCESTYSPSPVDPFIVFVVPRYERPLWGFFRSDFVLIDSGLALLFVAASAFTVSCLLIISPIPLPQPSSSSKTNENSNSFLSSNAALRAVLSFLVLSMCCVWGGIMSGVPFLLPFDTSHLSPLPTSTSGMDSAAMSDVYLSQESDVLLNHLRSAGLSFANCLCATFATLVLTRIFSVFLRVTSSNGSNSSNSSSAKEDGQRDAEDVLQTILRLFDPSTSPGVQASLTTLCSPSNIHISVSVAVCSMLACSHHMHPYAACFASVFAVLCTHCILVTLPASWASHRMLHRTIAMGAAAATGVVLASLLHSQRGILFYSSSSLSSSGGSCREGRNASESGLLVVVQLGAVVVAIACGAVVGTAIGVSVRIAQNIRSSVSKLIDVGAIIQHHKLQETTRTQPPDDD